ncbi:hypothetical protein AB0D15_33655, partial [Streptomyces sp. NPDC048551]
PLMVVDDPRQHNGYQYGNNSPLTEWDPTGEALDECRSGMYTCTNGGTRPTGYGNNYEREVHASGGTPAPEYVRQKTRVRNACRHDPDCGSSRSYGSSSRSTPASAAKRGAKKPEKGFIASIKTGDFKGAWNSPTWKHKVVDMGIKFVAGAGTTLCIASAVCGMGLFVVGAAALFTVGLGAHMAVASEEEREQGDSQFIVDTAKSEAVGIASGALWGRGALFAFTRGGTSKAAWAAKGEHLRTNGFFAGGIPIAHTASPGAALLRTTREALTNRFGR